MASYNHDYLADSVECILNQSYENIELVLVNDNPIVFLENIWGEKVTVINNTTNLGLTVSLNKGLQACDGDIVARIDSDDYCHPDRAKIIADSFLSGGEHLFFSKAKTVSKFSFEEFDFLSKDNTETTLAHNDVQSRLLKNNIIPHSTIALPKNVLIKIGGYNVNYKFSQDLELYFRLLRQGCIFKYNSSILVNRTVDQNVISIKNRKSQILFSILAKASYSLANSNSVLYKGYLSDIVRLAVPNFIRRIIHR